MIITVSPSTDGHNLFSATSSAGHTLVERSPAPLLDSARALMAMSTSYSSHELLMIHAGSSIIALRATSIGYAAQLEVTGTRFTHYHRRAVARGSVLESEG